MEALEIESIDLYPKENSEHHHTKNFELVHSDPVITVLRRGQYFKAVIKFVNRGYDPNNDKLLLVFSIGDEPNLDKNTQANITLIQGDNPRFDYLQWSGFIKNKNEYSISLQISSPCNAPVGIWSLKVVTDAIEGDFTPKEYKFENDIYILFNPWNIYDSVYMGNVDIQEEFVNSEIGKVWVGPLGSTKGRAWVFGQFDAVVLPACILMFNRANMEFSQRGDPIQVVRVISKIICSDDGRGVLIGRWNGLYDDGTAPSSWIGSVPILQQFLETQKEVRYGQCWVIACVVTTVCRALGIPTRVVTNVVSAHVADGALTVDKYYTADMEEIDTDPGHPEKVNSIWNYHVWNDVWIDRPDLPLGYGGWQVIDAIHHCGPASLDSVSVEAFQYNYDVNILFAPLNAKLIRWRKDPTSERGFTKIHTYKYHVGRIVMTKKPLVFDPIGESDRELITHLCKYMYDPARKIVSLNSSELERDQGPFSITENLNEDIDFQLEELKTVKIGENFKFTVNIKNKSNKVQEVKAILRATSVFYTGATAHIVKKTQKELTVKPGAIEHAELLVSVDDYLEHLVEYCNMKQIVVCTVKESNETWAEEVDFQIEKPTIEIKFSDSAFLRQQVKATLSFVNPLQSTLTKCVFNLSGPGLVKRILTVRHVDVPARGIIKNEVALTPTAIGLKTLVVTFNSLELTDLMGTATIEVFEK